MVIWGKNSNTHTELFLFILIESRSCNFDKSTISKKIHRIIFVEKSASPIRFIQGPAARESCCTVQQQGQFPGFASQQTVTRERTFTAQYSSCWVSFPDVLASQLSSESGRSQYSSCWVSFLDVLASRTRSGFQKAEESGG